jgi:hypothetical protein
MVGRRAMERRECQERLESCHRATAAVEPERELVVASTGPVVLELLQGCRSEPERGRLEQYLRALHRLPMESE